jgi:transposase-like protein
MKAEGQMPTDTKLRSSKYLNNLIEQDHRGVKARIGPMLGFKRFRTAAVTIAGIGTAAPDPEGTGQPPQAAPQR